MKDSEVWVNEDGTIEGYVITRPEYIKKYQPNADQRIYFSAVVDKKAASCGTFNGEEIHEGQTYAHGIGAGAYLDFQTTKNEQITIKVGISFTSVQNARINLKAEATGVSFDQAKAGSQLVWEEALSRILVEGKNGEDLKKFYSGLYHALLGRGVMSDVNGAYPKHDGTIGQVPMEGGNPKFQMFNTVAFAQKRNCFSSLSGLEMVPTLQE